MLDQNDANLVVFLSGGSGCSLDSSPKKNWVENSGGLPNYICKIAKAVMKGGKSKSAAIAIAVSRTKKWAAGGDDVDADTQAKAAAAVAEWNALKAKNAAKQVVKASRSDDSEYLILSNLGSFNTDRVRRAWEDLNQRARQAQRAANIAAGQDAYAIEVPYSYIRELWTDHIIADVEGPAERGTVKVPYTVTATTVEFGDPVTVEQVYVEVEEELTEFEAALLGDLVILSDDRKSFLDTVAALASKK